MRYFNWLHRLAAAENFYRFADKLIPAAGFLCAALLAAGAVLGLAVAPADYVQGDAYRIIFVHVPAAWLSLFIYVAMAMMGGAGLIWKFKMCGVLAVASAPIGASFTLLTLASGSLWGKPMWGAWWVWDARLTSELLLLFLYLGFIALQNAVADKQVAWRAGAILLVAGVINIPIIHFSVDWWNTLHQPATIAKLGAPSIHFSMLAPLLLMAAAFLLFYIFVLLMSAQTQLLSRGGEWTKRLFDDARRRP